MLQILRTPDGVPFLRTDEAAFEGLPDYPFAPRYIEVEGLRLHYVDEGPRDGPTVLLMHGMPTWSFLNRHIIRDLVAAGYRCIAADHIGFGRSDKVTDDSWYSIARHVEAHQVLVESLDLREATLFCQDWGGPIGLAQAARSPERFSRLVIMNTWLHHEAYAYTDALRRWNAGWQPGGVFGDNVPDPLTIGTFMMIPLGMMPARDLYAVIQGGPAPELTPDQEAIRRGYDAPFAGLGHAGHAGPRRFPLSLPFYNPEGGAAEAQTRDYDVLLNWTGPVHFIWGGLDDVFTEAWGRQWAASYPQATFDLLPDAGHFPQETHGAEIARLFLDRVAAGR